MNVPLFDLRNVQVAYQNNVALQDISLQIREGEKIALIGASGAGKTTLLLKLYEMEKAQSAFVHQHYALVPQLSVFHNVYIGRLDRHKTWYNLLNLIKPQTKDLDEILPILDTLGMREKASERIDTLSGGQQQRVAIGRAMYRGGSVLLADEPVSSIDPHQADTIMQLIMDAQKTVILSLHAVEFALQFAQRIIGLRSGRIFFDLPAAQITPSMLSELYAPC